MLTDSLASEITDLTVKLACPVYLLTVPNVISVTINYVGLLVDMHKHFTNCTAIKSLKKKFSCEVGRYQRVHCTTQPAVFHCDCHSAVSVDLQHHRVTVDVAT